MLFLMEFISLKSEFVLVERSHEITSFILDYLDKREISNYKGIVQRNYLKRSSGAEFSSKSLQDNSCTLLATLITRYLLYNMPNLEVLYD